MLTALGCRGGIEMQPTIYELRLKDVGRNNVPSDVRMAMLLKAALRAYGFRNLSLVEVKPKDSAGDVRAED